MPSPTILAATIVFSGLILHFQDPSTNAKRAILVDEKPTHQPLLTVANSHRVRADGTWTVVQTGSGSRPWIYDLSGERLKVVGPSGPVTHSAVFDKVVPSLKEIVDPADDLTPLVKAGSAHVGGKTATFLDYSGGSLGVKSCYKTAGEYNPRTAKDPRCFAREVAFTPNTSTEWEIQDVDDPARKIVFTRNAIVGISNDFLVAGPHQKHYSDLLLAGSTVRDIKHTDLDCSTDCVMISIRKGKGANIECSNNQWP